MQYNATNRLTWICVDATAEDWELAGESAAIDAVIDATGLTSLAAMRTFYGALRPWLTKPPTDSTRNVLIRGQLALNQVDCKTHGTKGRTAKCLGIYPQSISLDANGLPAVDCRDIESGFLRIYWDQVDITLDQAGQDELTQVLSIGAGDICGWTDAANPLNTDMLGSMIWVHMAGHVFISGNNGASGAWNDRRIAVPLAYGTQGANHSATTTVLFGLYNNQYTDMSGLTLRTNGGGRADSDNICIADMRGFSTAWSRFSAASCGTGVLITGGGGRQLDGRASYIGLNHVGLAIGNELGQQNYVAADCIQGGAFCTGTRQSPSGVEGLPQLSHFIIEGNGINIWSAGGLWLDPGYVEGDLEGGDIVVGGGVRSDTRAACCLDPDGSGKERCVAPEESHSSTPAGSDITYINVSGSKFDGVIAGSVDFCIGPGANRGQVDEVDLRVGGMIMGKEGTFSGGEGHVDKCIEAGAPWSCCTGPRAGTCRPPTVDVTGLTDLSNWASVEKPPGYAGRWIGKLAGFGKRSLSSTWKTPLAADDLLVGELPFNLFPTAFSCVAQGLKASIQVSAHECDSNGSSCSAIGAVANVKSVNTRVRDTTFTDRVIEVDDWVRFNVDSVETAPDSLTCTLEGWPSD
jgi:hypothetical protein